MNYTVIHVRPEVLLSFAKSKTGHMKARSKLDRIAQGIEDQAWAKRAETVATTHAMLAEKIVNPSGLVLAGFSETVTLRKGRSLRDRDKLFMLSQRKSIVRRDILAIEARIGKPLGCFRKNAKYKRVERAILAELRQEEISLIGQMEVIRGK